MYAWRDIQIIILSLSVSFFQFLFYFHAAIFFRVLIKEKAATREVFRSSLVLRPAYFLFAIKIFPSLFHIHLYTRVSAIKIRGFEVPQIHFRIFKLVISTILLWSKQSLVQIERQNHSILTKYGVFICILFTIVFYLCLVIGWLSRVVFRHWERIPISSALIYCFCSLWNSWTVCHWYHCENYFVLPSQRILMTTH